MGIMASTIRLHMPRGQAHVPAGDGKNLFNTFAACAEKVRADIDQLAKESQPGTAKYLLPLWMQAIGISYDEKLPLEKNQARAEFEYTFRGTMQPDRLEERIQLEFPGITVTEPTTSPHCGEAECAVTVCGNYKSVYGGESFVVSGTVETPEDYQRLKGLISKYAPLHLAVSYKVTVKDDYRTNPVCAQARCRTARVQATL